MLPVRGPLGNSSIADFIRPLFRDVLSDDFIAPPVRGMAGVVGLASVGGWEYATAARGGSYYSRCDLCSSGCRDWGTSIGGN